MTAADIGGMGERIAIALWPSMRLVKSGSHEDLEGMDAWDEGRRIQIKTDRRIDETENVFHEIYKRDGTWESYGPGVVGAWRRSPSNADEYVFVGQKVAVRATVDMLARAEGSLVLKSLRPNGSGEETAMGFLIPIARLVDLDADVRRHKLWPVAGPAKTDKKLTLEDMFSGRRAR